jgi:hypothetical protein
MPGWELGLIIAVIVLAGIVAWLFLDRRKSARLQSRFGPEYDRTLHEHGSRRLAERELERREHRVEKLHVHPLSMAERDRYVAAWRIDQARFVDDPAGAVTEADRLVQEVMKARGYPVADFDQRVEDISVDHPHLVQNYRAARDIAARHNRGEASTEDLRRALVFYRGLFDELLEVQEVHR